MQRKRIGWITGALFIGLMCACGKKEGHHSAGENSEQNQETRTSQDEIDVSTPANNLSSGCEISLTYISQPTTAGLVDLFQDYNLMTRTTWRSLFQQRTHNNDLEWESLASVLGATRNNQQIHIQNHDVSKDCETVYNILRQQSRAHDEGYTRVHKSYFVFPVDTSEFPKSYEESVNHPALTAPQPVVHERISLHVGSFDTQYIAGVKTHALRSLQVIPIHIQCQNPMTYSARMVHTQSSAAPSYQPVCRYLRHNIGLNEFECLEFRADASVDECTIQTLRSPYFHGNAERSFISFSGTLNKMDSSTEESFYRIKIQKVKIEAQ